MSRTKVSVSMHHLGTAEGKLKYAAIIADSSWRGRRTLKSDKTRTPGTHVPGFYNRVGRAGQGSDKTLGLLVRFNSRNHMPAQAGARSYRVRLYRHGRVSGKQNTPEATYAHNIIDRTYPNRHGVSGAMKREVLKPGGSEARVQGRLKQAVRERQNIEALTGFHHHLLER